MAGGAIAHWNAAAERATGLPAALVVGKQLEQFLAPFVDGQEDRAREVAAVAGAVVHPRRGEGCICDVSDDGSFRVRWRADARRGSEPDLGRASPQASPAGDDGAPAQGASAGLLSFPSRSGSNADSKAAAHRPPEGKVKGYRAAALARKFRRGEAERLPPQRFAFACRGDGVQVAHLSLSVLSTAEVGYAACVGQQDAAPDYSAWALETVRAMFKEGVKEGGAPRYQRLLAAPVVDASAWGALNVRQMLRRAVSNATLAMDAGARGTIEAADVRSDVPKEVVTDGEQLKGTVGYLLNCAVDAAASSVTVPAAVGLRPIDPGAARRPRAEGSDARFLRICVADDRETAGVPEHVSAAIAPGRPPAGSPRGGLTGLRKTQMVAEELGGWLDAQPLDGYGLRLSIIVPLICPEPADVAPAESMASTYKSPRAFDYSTATSPGFAMGLGKSGAV
eukprot:gene1915-1030_t